MSAPRVDPTAVIRSRSGAASAVALREAGCSRRRMSAALADGSIIRVRPGWYAVPDAPREVVQAVRVGGALTGASVARLHGLWLLDDPLLHVRVPGTASRLRSPDDATVALDRTAHGVCVHYRAEGGDASHSGVASDGLMAGIAEMFRCSGTLPAMIALESALNREVLPIQALESLRAMVPAWAQRQLDLATPDSDSGLETIARLLMHRLRIPVRTQVQMPGVRRVDLLVGDRLILELDGRAFHSGDDFERDRVQDLELALRGYLVVRLSYRMVTAEWDTTHRALRELVARGLHRWGRAARPGAVFAGGGVQDAGDEALDGP
ncbi:endonuclease domain-containing protein [Agromyces bauzanensis]